MFLKKCVFLLCFFPILYGAEKTDFSQTQKSSKTLKILLYNCEYGAGHKMATEAIVESLPDCQIKVVDIYRGPLKPLDPMRKLCSPLNFENFYNRMAKSETNWLLNFFGKLGPHALYVQRNRIQNLLTIQLIKQKPDLVISCIPIINSFLFTSCKEQKIPLLVIPTDIDIAAFCFGLSKTLENEENLSQKIKMMIPYGKKEWGEIFSKKYSPKLQSIFQYACGYPTRKAFAQSMDEKTKEEMRKFYQIEPDENLILIMMGGNASYAAKNYVNLLLNLSDDELDQIVGKEFLRKKIRVICLCGDVSLKTNRQFMKELNQMNQTFSHHPRVTIFATPGTPKIAELVSLPELFTVISKPGGSTVNEMIKKRVPMVYHVSNRVLQWERGNLEFGEKLHFGKRFVVSGVLGKKDRQKLIQVLKANLTLHEKLLKDPNLMPESFYDFRQNLRKAVQEMQNFPLR